MISLEEVTKSYGHTKALDKITVELNDNKIYCLLGCNGAGKTTLLKLIAGHINATSGNVKIDDNTINTLKMPCCVHFIENRAAHFNIKIESIVKMASELNDEFDYEFAENMIEKFHLDKNKKYKTLSFGMQAMLNTLLNLASNKKVVLLDEPVLGLDAIMRGRFYDLLNDSYENHPRIIIVSTHLIDEIAKGAEELLILDKGKIIHRSSIDEIDEMAYSITGTTKEIEPILDSLNVIGRKTIGGHTSAFIYDDRSRIPIGFTGHPIGLQEFFINMVEGDSDEN